jgi:uncharacterized membrane protein (DUF2068 family)
LQKSSLDRRQLAFRAVALIYAALTVYFAVVVGRALTHHPHVIRGANLGYAVFAAATAYGLWVGTQWGKTLGLIMALGTSSLGVIAIVTVVFSHHGSLIGWIAVFVISTALTYVLSRPIFNPPIDDI